MSRRNTAGWYGSQISTLHNYPLFLRCHQVSVCGLHPRWSTIASFGFSQMQNVWQVVLNELPILAQIFDGNSFPVPCPYHCIPAFRLLSKEYHSIAISCKPCQKQDLSGICSREVRDAGSCSVLCSLSMSNSLDLQPLLGTPELVTSCVSVGSFSDTSLYNTDDHITWRNIAIFLKLWQHFILCCLLKYLRMKTEDKSDIMISDMMPPIQSDCFCFTWWSCLWQPRLLGLTMM